MSRARYVLAASMAAALAAAPLAQTPAEAPAPPTVDPRTERLKAEVLTEVESMATFTQQMV
ncbi:MAG: hypothetical protein ACRD15_01235, partial [Vicinamibacterales bacterium]